MIKDIVHKGSVLQSGCAEPRGYPNFSLGSVNSYKDWKGYFYVPQNLHYYSRAVVLNFLGLVYPEFYKIVITDHH